MVTSTPQNMATHPELPGVEVYLLKIDPEVAQEILNRNIIGQRRLSPDAVERYASDMAAYEWVFNGAPILIDEKNQLIDGQHRLNAIIEADEAQIVVIVRGVSTDAMGTVDMNRRRSYADTLAMRHIKNHVAVAAINGRLWYWFHGNYGLKGVARVAVPKFLAATPSNSAKDLQMLKVEEAYNITVEQAAAFAIRAARQRPGIVSSIYGLMWVLLSGVDKDQREKFFFELLEQQDPQKITSAVMMLINRLGRLKVRETMKPVDQLDALIVTFNRWVNGEGGKTLMPPRPVRFDTVAQLDGWTELEDK